jgi:hypothetical protein
MTYPAPLTPQQINQVIQAATLAYFGLTPEPAAYALVRVGWQTQGEPAWAITDDVCIINCVEEDDPYNRTRDMSYIPVLDESEFNEVTTYTRVWGVRWTLYGPNSYDRARIIRSALYTQLAHDIIYQANLFAVMDFPAPVRAPELFAGQWWERVDFKCQFNEAVTEAPTVNAVESVEVITETASGIISDVTIKGEQ